MKQLLMSSRVALVLGAALLVVGPGLAAAPRAAPNVTLERPGGALVELSAYKGKVVLIDFWASWCPPCKASFPALDALQREYRGRDVAVLAVNLDERRKDADAFLSEHANQLTVLFDPKGASPLAFGVKGMPSSFLLDRSGAIRFTHMGYSGEVSQAYRRELTELLAEAQKP